MTLRKVPADAPEELDDVALVRAAQSGNRAAFGQLVNRYKTLVFSLAYSRTDSPALSDDVAQDCFIQAWRDLGHLRDPTRFRAWICRIARRVSSRLDRKKSRPAYASPAAVPFMAAELPSGDPSPLDQIILREEEAVAWRALRQLPETYREPIVLYYQEGGSVETVARALELTEENVKKRLLRGRRMLHAQVLAAIESALLRVPIRRQFTAGVLAAIALGAAARPAEAAVSKLAAVKAAAAGIVALAGVAGLMHVARSRPPRAPATTLAAAPAGAGPPAQWATPAAFPVIESPAAEPTEHAAEITVLSFDFEDGLLPAGFDAGHVVVPPARNDSRHAIMATLWLPSPAEPRPTVRVTALDIPYRDTLVLELDHWLGADVDGLSVQVWNQSRRCNFTGRLDHLPRERWGHVSLPLSALTPIDDGAPAAPGDRITSMSVSGGRFGGAVLLFDNVRLIDRPSHAATNR